LAQPAKASQNGAAGLSQESHWGPGGVLGAARIRARERQVRGRAAGRAAHRLNFSSSSALLVRVARQPTARLLVGFEAGLPVDVPARGRDRKPSEQGWVKASAG
jgi:hypothetical protein